MDDDFNQRFEAFLADTITSEEAKKKCRTLPLAKKKELVAEHIKVGASVQQGTDVYIKYLQKEKNYKNLHQCLEKLRVDLKSKGVSWVREFGQNSGLDCLLNILQNIYRENDAKGKAKFRIATHSICIKCLQAFMNSAIGLQQIFDHENALVTLAKSINIRYIYVMVDAVKLMAAICLVPPVGHEKVLEALTICAELENRGRFSQIIEGLKITDNDPLVVSCMQLVNAVISSVDDLEFKLHLRNEIVRAGLGGILDTFESARVAAERQQQKLYLQQVSQNPLRKLASEIRTNGVLAIPHDSSPQVPPISMALALQTKIFHEAKDEDLEELYHRYEIIRFDMNDPDECYHLLKASLSDTSSEQHFLSILQHLLLIRDDPFARPAYYRLIEECLTQIVLHRNGLDPDFSLTKRFNVDVDYVIDQIVERTKMELPTVMAPPAAPSPPPMKQSQVPSHPSPPSPTPMTSSQPAQPAHQTQPTQPSHPPPPPPQMQSNKTPAPPPPPPPPPMTPTLAPVPPPPPPPPPMNSSTPVPPPPPPPPPTPPIQSSLAGPPPPPPPPPPPAMSSGQPPPPPPPPMAGSMPPINGFQPPPSEPQGLPFGLKPKRTWDLKTPVKRTNWNKIPVQKLTEEAFWIHVDETKLDTSGEICEALANKFSTDPKSRIPKQDSQRKGPEQSATLKKSRDLKVLDQKIAQNLMITLSSSKMTPDEVIKYIISIDESHLNAATLQQLIHLLPQQQQLVKLEAFRGQIDELHEAEQFALSLGSIKRLEPRLTSIIFKLRFEEYVGDIKPLIVAATNACQEVKDSKKLEKILKFVLLIGNVLNSGSNRGGAFGFEISFLPKLVTTKADDNKTTLLHFLADTVEKKAPDALNFFEEIAHVDKASRISPEQLQKSLEVMKRSISDLEKDLRIFKPHNSEDRFGEVMGKFCQVASERFNQLQTMFTKMEKIYKKLAVYYAFDPKTYTMDEFFTDIKTFKDQFICAHKENAKIREQEERKRRVYKEQEKRELERQKRLQFQNIADNEINGEEDDKKTIIDNMMSLLESGEAFDRRKGPRRVRVADMRNKAQTGVFNSSLLASGR